MTFSNDVIISLCLAGVLIAAVVIAVIVIFRIKNKDTWLPALPIGAATFALFALVLEGIVNMIFAPLVSGNNVALMIYGGFAAGIFEETGRFVAYKLLMKKHYTTKNAVFMGLGHGGFEAIFIGAGMMFSYAVMAITVNSIGVDEFMATMNTTDAATVDAMNALLENIAGYDISTSFLALLERMSAMTAHASLSVYVYFAVSKKGFIWLYPAAILIHALFDMLAVYASKADLSIIAVELIVLAGAVIIALGAFGLSRYFKKREAQPSAEA